MRTASSLNVLALSGLFVSIFLPLALYAETAPIKPLTLGPVGANGDIPQGLVSCFDYYRFGSTPVNITSLLTQVSQGEQISFAGEVRNDNPHPVIGASVYVKILRMRTNGEKDANGPDVMDWFTVAKPITLRAGETVPVSFEWNIPSNARPGEYAAAVYVAASERFNTFGLSFTDDVVGSMARFSVTGSGSEPLLFDKTSITVGDQQFRFAAFPPRVGGKEPVEVRARVANNSSASKRFSVTWKLYSWDGLRTDRLLDERTTESEAVAGKGIELSYRVTDLLHPVYYLLGKISDGASKSLIGVRFVRTDVQEPRIADIGVTPYPTANSSMVYACVHSMSGAKVENASFDISVEPNGPIAKLRQSIFRGETRKTYEGAIPSAIVALAMPLSHISDSFTVHARLLSNGSVVDDVTVSYLCKEIGTPCTSPLILSTLILALVLLLFITTVVVTRRVSRHRPMRDKKVL